MFRILCDPSSGSVERARLASWFLDLQCVLLVRRVEN